MSDFIITLSFGTAAVLGIAILAALIIAAVLWLDDVHQNKRTK